MSTFAPETSHTILITNSLNIYAPGNSRVLFWQERKRQKNK